MRFFLAVALVSAAWPCWSLSAQAREFMKITAEISRQQRAAFYRCE